MWVRGLKLRLSVRKTRRKESHPMWVRGLKPERNELMTALTKVAPHVGAWIETIIIGIFTLR